MFTAKLDRKKLLIGFIVFVLVICAIVLFFRKDGTSQTSAMGKTVKNNDQRVEYLKSFGWEVDTEPIDEETVVIPRKFTDVYAKYNDIQKSQGFDLSEYGGMEAVRYTYKVLNYPGEKDVVADIIVFRSNVIAGDVQSISLDGFMHGLEFPSSSSN